MARQILGREIDAVAIVEDNLEARKGYAWPLEDLELQPKPLEGPLQELEVAASEIQKLASAALCDHHLRKANYAPFNGAEAVALWYDSKFPAVLCTKWEKADIDEIRSLRRKIPALIQPDQLSEDPELFVRSIEECLFEMTQDFRPERRPWRAQIYVAEVDEDPHGMLYVEVQGWQLNEVVRLRKRDIPEQLRANLAPEFRCHASVNLGAEDADSIYFSEWEA